MSDDYIKRENAKRAVCGCTRDTGIDEAPFEYAEGLLEDVPAEDVEPVVRCRDCAWWTKQEASCQGRCARLGIYPTGTWYCANGAKMDGDEMSDMAMKYEDWLRGCVHHDGRKGNVYLPCDTVLAIADWIEAHRDVAQVRHGRWIEHYKSDAPPTLRSRWICSWCGNVQTYGATGYCPNCGAKMDGGDTDA